MLSAKDVAYVFEYISYQTAGAAIEKTRLMKLLYFAQGHALAELGHVLFPNQIDAWEYGPVVATVFRSFDKIIERVNSKGISDVTVSPEEIDLIMDVWERYRKYTAKELVALTHQPDTPWSDVYKPNVKNFPIPTDLIKKYFSRPENRLKRAPVSLPAVDALPAEDYDPEEDAVWEALLDDAR